MSVINLLSPHVADMIAAGEVVERPASVVKELTENAVDAGAKHITVELKKGGMGLVRVSDDGCGMSPEDAGMAFLRHATSKLRDERGLEAIATLGFRGEALAAISAVSHVELITRERGTDEGTRVLLSAGEIMEMGPAGCPEGTVMSVSDLFYNTPARRKFMKSDRAEGGACTSAALRCALGRPDISFRLLRDGEEQFFSPGDGNQRAAVYSLLGREVALSMLPCAAESDGIRVEGFVTAPHAGRGNRNLQHFFLNGRAFRSGLVQSALEQAYRNTLLTGKFPGCVLYLTMGFHKADVNVHPTKMEVRFTEEKKVFGAVYAAVRSALEEREEQNTLRLRIPERRLAPELDGERPAAPEPEPSPDPDPRAEWKVPLPPAGRAPAVGDTPRAGRPFRVPAASERLSGTWEQTGFSLPRDGGRTLRFHSPDPADDIFAPAAPPPRSPVFSRAELSSPPETRFSSSPAVAETDGIRAPAAEAVPEPLEAQPASEAQQKDWRVVGEVMDTYLLVEQPGALLLIDKHACHERMNFDRLKAGLGPQMSQLLLTPLSWSPGAETAEVLEQNAALLEEAGFAVERFGEDGVVLRAAPAELAGGELAALEEVAEALKNGRAEDPRDEVLRTVACKAAIKAGAPSQLPELEILAEKVVSGEIRYCPHGRPVAARLTREDLDRQFRRIV